MAKVKNEEVLKEPKTQGSEDEPKKDKKRVVYYLLYLR